MRWALPRLDATPHSAAAWAKLPARRLVRARDAEPPRQATIVRAAVLGESLLVRYECADADAWSTFRERDQPLWREEAVELFIAPGEQVPRRYAEIEVSPNGVLFDAFVDNPDGERATMRVDSSWDYPGIAWRFGSLGGALGSPEDWWVEIRLPLRALVPEREPLPPHWRANFYRIERPRRGGLPEELSAWAPTHRDPDDFHVPGRFGLLELPPRAFRA
jgi:hypothetical protein